MVPSSLGLLGPLRVPGRCVGHQGEEVVLPQWHPGDLLTEHAMYVLKTCKKPTEKGHKLPKVFEKKNSYLND